MERQIKFRAWDGKNMFYFDDNSRVVLIYNKICGWNVIPNVPNYSAEYIAGESQSKTPQFTLMQFTGLTDKNGKEIYEGDILRDGKGGNGAVFYAAPQFCVHADGEIFSLAEGKVNVSKLEYTQVIGNIHENPELLNQ